MWSVPFPSPALASPWKGWGRLASGLVGAISGSGAPTGQSEMLFPSLFSPGRQPKGTPLEGEAAWRSGVPRFFTDKEGTSGALFRYDRTLSTLVNLVS